MNTAIERFRAHFAERRSIAIPELSDENGPLVIYWQGVSLADTERVRRAVSAKGADSSEFAIRLIIAKAEDAEGRRLFDIGDLPTFKAGVSADIVSRISGAMLGIVKPEDATKN